MYIEVKNELAYRLQTGGATVMVSSRASDGTDDVMTAAWGCPYDYGKAMVVLALEHKTTENILHSGEFVVQLPKAEQLKTLLAAGSVSGRECGDKFKAIGVQPQAAKAVKVSVVPGCAAYLECQLEDKELFARTGILIGKVVAAYADAALWDEKSETFAAGIMATVHHVSGSTFVTGGKTVEG